MALFSAFFLLLLISGATGETVVNKITGTTFFDCRRASQQCGTDGVTATATLKAECNAPYSECTCTSPSGELVMLADKQCYDSSKVLACDTNKECKNFGQCKKYDGTDKCFCTPQYTGADCGTPRVKVECAADKITVDVNPIFGSTDNFEGLIYAKDKQHVAECKFTITSKKPVAKDFLFADASKCGMTGHDVEIQGNKQPTLDIIVQYHKDYLTTFDQRITVGCSNPDDGALDKATFQGTVDVGAALSAGEGIKQTFKVDMEVQKGDGNPKDAITNIGSEMQAKVTFAADTHFLTFKVHTCDIKSADGTKSVVLVDNAGCPGTAGGVVRGAHTGTKTTFVVIPFFAFMFLADEGTANSQYTSNLLLTCNVKLCTGAKAADCNTDCSGVNTGIAGLGRKRRAASGSQTTLIQTFTVTSVVGNKTTTGLRTIGSGSGSGQYGEASRCLGNPQMQTVLAVLGLVLVLAVVALASVAFLYCRARNQQSDHIKYVDNYAMGSSTQTLHGPKV